MAKGFYNRSSSFSLSLKKFAEKAAANADLVVAKVVHDMGVRIVERSPVGDATLWSSPPPKGYIGGRFRANWQYGNYSGAGIPQQALPDIDPSGGASIARIAAGIPAKGAAGMRHVLVNNLPYGQRLEDGWSSQAPAGMVHLTVIEFQQFVERAAEGLQK